MKKRKRRIGDRGLDFSGVQIVLEGGVYAIEVANFVGLYFLPSGFRGFGELRRRCETGNLLIALFYWFFVFLFF